MDQESRSGHRSRRGAATVVAIVAVAAVLSGVGLWANSAGPFAPALTPEIIYTYLSGDPTPSPSSATTTAEATPSGSATAEPTGGIATAEPTVVAPTPFRPATFVLAKPNFEYSYHTVPNMKCGVSFTMSVGVRNSGTVASPASTVALVDSYSGIITVGANSPFAALAPGASVNVPFVFAISRGCGLAHTLVLRIDPSDHVDETYEADNVLELTHTVRAPNLYLTDLTVPAHPRCNAVTVGVRVNNNGSVATPTAGTVRFTDTYSGAPSYSTSVYVNFPMIEAGTSRIVSQTFPALPYCNHQHTMTAVVDPDGEILETNDSDNTAATTYQPDL